jgi:hypothetical protein
MNVKENGDKSFSWRYKMTVEIDTPEGVRAGSAVREVNVYWKKIGWSEINNQPHYSNKQRTSGEAVVVDLGDRGKIFALIDDTAYRDVLNAFDLKKYEDVVALPIGSKAALKCDEDFECPRMVMFKDMDDAKSIELVYIKKAYADGKKQIDNFEKLFGNGVGLKKIVIEITDAQKTNTGILETLPNFNEGFWEWLKKLRYGDPRRASGGNFSSGGL